MDMIIRLSQTLLSELSLFLVIALLAFQGCGKPADQKAAEERLNAEVMQLHERQMDGMAEIQNLIAAIDIELANHDRLVREHPRQLAGQTSDDLVNARKMLLATKSMLNRWMSSYRPYDAAANHDTVMVRMNADREALLGIQASADAARAAAQNALESHRKLSEQVAAARTGKR